MKTFFPFLLLLIGFLVSCKERDPLEDPIDAARITGTWRSMTPVHPDWEYQFYNGFMCQTLHDFGLNLASLEYTYATRNDTVFIGGDLHDPARIWKVYFHCDSIVEVRNVTPGTLLFGRWWLKKTAG